MTQFQILVLRALSAVLALLAMLIKRQAAPYDATEEAAMAGVAAQKELCKAVNDHYDERRAAPTPTSATAKQSAAAKYES